MPITQLDKDKFTQVCAACGAERSLSLSDAKPEDTDEGDHLLRLPACSNCGSIELLVPQQTDPDTHPNPGGFTHLHRLLIDELDEHVAPARVNAALKSRRAKHFPNGFKVRLPRGLVPSADREPGDRPRRAETLEPAADVTPKSDLST